MGIEQGRGKAVKCGHETFDVGTVISVMGKMRIVIAIAAAAILAATLGLLSLCGKPPPTNGTDGTGATGLAISRPDSAASPRKSPLRPQPDLDAPVAPVPAGEPPDDLSDDGEEEEIWDEDDESGEPDPEDVEAPVLRDDDPALSAMDAELAFFQSVRDAIAELDEEGDVLKECARLLDSDRPEDRALAGILLFFVDELSGDVLDGILDDEDILVPLMVCDWIRDNGSEEEAGEFKAAFAARDYSAEDFRDFAMDSAGLPGGGRSALDAFLSMHGEDDVPVEDLADIVASTNASYDVREQALFKLLEPETRKEGMAALDAFSAGLAPGSGALDPFVAAKMAELAKISNADGDEEKIWDAESAVVFFLSQTEGGLQARDLANYLEYALRRDDPEFPPIVEEGTWEFANEFLLAARDRMDELPRADADALDRIAVCLDRLAEYDPAFNPFETVEDDGQFDAEEDDGEETDYGEDSFDGDEEDSEDGDWEEDDSWEEEEDDDPEGNDDEDDGEFSEEDDWEVDDPGEDDDT